jgi:DUF917 family protein
MMSLSDLGPNDWTCVVGVAGNPDSPSVQAVLKAGIPAAAVPRTFNALNTFNQGKGNPPFRGVIPVEMGAGAIMWAIATAAMNNIPVVDASGASGAVALLQMTVFASAGLNPAPLYLADDNTALQPQRYLNDTTAVLADAEINRQFAPNGQFPKGYASFSLWPMTGATANQAALSGTITSALNNGLGVKAALASHSDPANFVAKSLGGRVAYRGKLVIKRDPILQGVRFDRGYAAVNLGGGQFAVVAQVNENEVLFGPNGQEEAAPPDLITFITPKGKGITAAEQRNFHGKEVAIVVVPAGSSMTKPSILAAGQKLLRREGIPETISFQPNQGKVGIFKGYRRVTKPISIRN